MNRESRNLSIKAVGTGVVIDDNRMARTATYMQSDIDAIITHANTRESLIEMMGKKCRRLDDTVKWLEGMGHNEAMAVTWEDVMEALSGRKMKGR